jgi:glyoxylase-like metal-dependent hydrolase (beta-lactamase superfamily II)
MSEDVHKTPSRRGMLKAGTAALAAGAAGAVLTGGADEAAFAATGTKSARRISFAPIPEQAKPLPMGPDGYRLDRIGPEMYAVTAAPGVQAAFVVSSAGVIVVDAPPLLASALPAAIKKVTSKSVTHLIYTHQHADHIANARVFGDVVRIAHAETARLIHNEQDPARPMPTVTFKDEYTLTVGDQRLVLSYPGANHDAGNIIIHAPRQRAAMMVDVVIPGWAPFRAWGTADSVPGVLRTHDVLAKLDIDTFVGGHIHRLGTPEDIKVSREFVYDLWNYTTNAMATTHMDTYLAQVEEGNLWAGFRLWFEAIADKVEPVIYRKWLHRLGAVDVFTRENIQTIALSHAIDAPHDLSF